MDRHHRQLRPLAFRCLFRIGCLPLLPGNELVQPFGLVQGTRKPVQNITAFGIILLKPVRHHVVHQLIRNQLALAHQLVGQHAQLGMLLPVLPQQIACGNLRNAVLRHQALGLRPLPDARRPEHQHGPWQKRLRCVFRFRQVSSYPASITQERRRSHVLSRLRLLSRGSYQRFANRRPALGEKPS